MGHLSEYRPVILIVEDDLLVRMNALETIGEAGFEVIEASNADEAIAVLEKRLTFTSFSPISNARFHGRLGPRSLRSGSLARCQDRGYFRLRSDRRSTPARRGRVYLEALSKDQIPGTISD